MKINPQFQPDPIFPTLTPQQQTAADLMLGSVMHELNELQLTPLIPPVIEIPVQPTGTELFPLGRVICTPAVREKCCPHAIGLALKSHAHGQWGPHLSKWDCLANDDAVKNGGRIVSRYRINDGVEIYVVTEAPRDVTVICLVSEY